MYHAHLAIILAITILLIPVPKIPTMASIITSLGKESIISQTLIITSSTQPLKNPEITPKSVPIVIVAAIVINDKNTVVLIPYKILENTHLPSWSVPNGY